MLTSVRRPQNPQIGPVRTQASTHLCNTYTYVFKLSNVVKCVRKLCVSKYPVNWPPQPSAEAEAVHRANSADFVSFKQTKSSVSRHGLKSLHYVILSSQSESSKFCNCYDSEEGQRVTVFSLSLSPLASQAVLSAHKPEEKSCWISIAWQIWRKNYKSSWTLAFALRVLKWPTQGLPPCLPLCLCIYYTSMMALDPEACMYVWCIMHVATGTPLKS